MEARPKILLLDDDQALLETYRGLLAQLPSQPEVRTAATGPRALAMLEAESFRLLICDLKLPKMDGLQVLAIVRRKYPHLRTVALTAVLDEQFRARAYALGVDLFWQKPGTEAETKLFLECLESLLRPGGDTGFRGVQSKSLVDIIQLECLSRNSVVLRITNGPLVGKIWIVGGEPVDAEMEGLTGEEAFQKILAWKTGSFETLPAEPARPRTIFHSYNALLLQTAQALDESRGGGAAAGTAAPATGAAAVPSGLDALAQLKGVEFILALRPDRQPPWEARGLEQPEAVAAWVRRTLAGWRSLGERLEAGPLQLVEGFGANRHVGLACAGENELCVGWQPDLPREEAVANMKKAVALWMS